MEKWITKAKTISSLVSGIHIWDPLLEVEWLILIYLNEPVARRSPQRESGSLLKCIHPTFSDLKYHFMDGLSPLDFFTLSLTCSLTLFPLCLLKQLLRDQLALNPWFLAQSDSAPPPPPRPHWGHLEMSGDTSGCHSGREQGSCGYLVDRGPRALPCLPNFSYLPPSLSLPNPYTTCTVFHEQFLSPKWSSLLKKIKYIYFKKKLYITLTSRTIILAAVDGEPQWKDIQWRQTSIIKLQVDTWRLLSFR